jgi:HEAT repeat protein
MRIAKTDLVFCASLLLSFVLFHLARKLSLLGDLAILPMIIPAFMFVFPLCQAFLQGIAAGHEQIRGTASRSAWWAFLSKVWRRAVGWLGLWISFFIAVEVYAYLVVGGGGGFVSALNAGFVLATAALCFFWAPRCQKLWTLSVLTMFTILPTYFLLFCLGASVVDALGYGGYMGLGTLFGAPYVALGCSLLLNVAMGFWSWTRGDAWFRLQRDGTSFDNDPVRRAKQQGVAHFLLGVAVVLGLPLVLNAFLETVIFSPGIAWIRQGELTVWPLATLDHFFLVTPYWTTYHPGWVLGFLPGLPLVVAAWGVLNQRRWGRQLVIAFHAQVAAVTIGVVVWSILACVAIGSEPNSPTYDAFAFCMAAGAISFGVAIVFGSFLWWISRAPTNETFGFGQWKPVGMLLVCCIGLTVASFAIEVAYNRMSVYCGEATFQDRSTGEWLVLLASRSAETRHAAMQELGKGDESVPVLREMYRSRPEREGDKRNLDGVHRAFWSRAFSALSYEANKKFARTVIIGQPLLQALDELATDENPEVRLGALRARNSLFADSPETAAAVLTALRDENPEVRKMAVSAFGHLNEMGQMDALPQLRLLAEDQQLPPETRQFASATITRIDPQTRVPRLTKQLNSTNSRTRAQAAWKLGCMGRHAESAVPAVTALLRDPDRIVRSNAASAIGMFGPAAADSVDELIEAFEQQDPVSRERIAFALGEIGHPAKPAVPALIQALEGKTTELLVSAAEALWKIDRRSDLAVPVLRNVSNEQGGLQQGRRAAQVLERIYHQEADNETTTESLE